jgi:hypothetical protein
MAAMLNPLFLRHCLKGTAKVLIEMAFPVKTRNFGR